MNINVIKSDGSKEQLDLNKIIRWSTWATQNCPDVSLEHILTSGSIQFFDGITTDQITTSIAENCEVIAIIESQSKNFKLSAQYLTVAKNLYIPNIIKKASRTQSKNLTDVDVYADEYKISDLNYIPLKRYKIKSVLQNGILLGVYDPELLDGTLSDAFFEAVDSLLDYSRVNLLHYGGLRQLEAKYISRIGKELIEDPQQHFALIASALVHSLSKIDPEATLESQIKDFKSYYDVFSTGKGNNPTPFSHNIRTKTKQYDSCLLFEIGDEIPSINEGMSTAMDATVAGAGVGVSLGAIRAKGTRYKSKGEHGGIGPYLQQLTATVKGSNQETRGGGATVNLPLWHRDVYELLMVKDNTSGTEGENRWRHLDYAFHYSSNLVSRLANNEKILLISPHEKLPNGKTVYEAFYNVDENGKYDDKEYLEFEQSILKDPNLFYINSSNVETAPLGKPVWTTAYDLFSLLAQQIMSTGRIYTFNATHVMNHSASLEPIKMSNLCMEITQPTSPISAKYNSKEHKYELNNGEASFCQLGAVVLGNTAYEDIEEVCKVLLNTQEAVFNISDYSSIPFSYRQKKRRNVGIGVVNLHYLLVKEVYSVYPEKDWIQKSGETVHKYMEAIQYYLIKASVELAKKFGPCELFHTTKYSKGILPIDTCTNTPNNSYPLLKDWESLRADVLKYGMRNCNLTASMPVESSSVPFGLINGKEKPRSPITYKGNKALMVAVAVPEIEKYGDKYIYAWSNTKINKNKLDLVIESNYTKFQDQASSFNNYFDLVKNPKIDELEVFEILFAAPNREGIKTSYYANFNTDSEETENNKVESSNDIVSQLKQEAIDEASAVGCASGMCKI